MNLIPFRSGNSWGFCDQNKNILFDCEYEQTNVFSEDLAAVCLRGRFGFINYNHELVIPFLYDNVTDFCDGISIVRIGDNYGCIDANGNTVLALKYKYINYISGGFYLIVQVGEDEDEYLNVYYNGNKMSDISYNLCGGPFIDDMALVYIKNKGFNFINTKGEFVFKAFYDDAKDISENLIVVAIQRKRLGYQDITGKIFYLEFGEYNAEQLILNNDYYDFVYYYGYIDKCGKEVIPSIFHKAESFSEGLAAIGILDNEQQMKFGFIDSIGNLIIPPLYDHCDSFKNGKAVVKTGENYQVIDIQGRVLLSDRYKSLSNCNGSAFIAQKYTWNNDGLYGVIDINNNVILLFNFYKIEFYDNFYVCELSGLKWIFDCEGNSMNEIAFEFVGQPTGGYVKVGVDLNRILGHESKNSFNTEYAYGFIDKYGKLSIECKYQQVGNFYNGLAKVLHNNKNGFIDENGNEFWQN